MALTWRCPCGSLVIGGVCGCGVVQDVCEPPMLRTLRFRRRRRPELVHPATRPWECRRTTPIVGEPTDAKEEYERPWPQEVA